jgi:hypothetical protein
LRTIFYAASSSSDALRWTVCACATFGETRWPGDLCRDRPLVWLPPPRQLHGSHAKLAVVATPANSAKANREVIERRLSMEWTESTKRYRSFPQPEI